jgi:hypothetical protein
MERLVLSVSDVKLYQTCPQLFMYKFVDRVGPKYDTSAAQLVGTAVHGMLEGKLRGNPEAKPKWGDEFDKASEETQEEATKAVLALLPALELWQPPDKWEIVDVEKELRKTITLNDGSEVELVGRLDCIVRAMGKLWHLQHKTCHSSKPTAVYAESVRTDWHETAYQVMAAEQYGEAFAGTILNCVRKLSAKRIAEDPSAVFELFYLHRPEYLIQQGWSDLTNLVDRMAWDITAYETDIPVLKNRMACAGIFGNSLCKYKDVCDGRR